MKLHIHHNTGRYPAYEAHLELRDEENDLVAIVNGSTGQAQQWAEKIVLSVNSNTQKGA